MIEAAIRDMVNRIIDEKMAVITNVLDKRKSELLTRNQVINDYQDYGVTSSYKIRQMEREGGLVGIGTKPILYKRSDIEKCLGISD